MQGLITRGPQPAGGAAIRPDEYGLIWLDRNGFVQYFAPDVDPTQARVLDGFITLAVYTSGGEDEERRSCGAMSARSCPQSINEMRNRAGRSNDEASR